MVAMLSTYTSWCTSTVTTTVGFGWRVASQILVRQSPVRIVFTFAATLMKEGVKVKIGTWVGKQKQKKQSSFVKGVKLTAKKTIKWAKRKRKRRNGPQSDTAQHDVVALDAGMKYKELAKRRLDAARASFEAAAIELKAAENGMQDAERYVKSLRAHCEHVGNQNAVIDVVFVEHADQNERDQTKTPSEKEVDRLDNNVLLLLD